MAITDFRDDTLEEINSLLSSDMTVEVTKTKTVPHANDPAITFPNIDGGTIKCKLIETAVLYVDLRRSTELSLEHKPQTVAKLYSAFVRSMTRCARYHGGHVRGIIGDRVMVIFDSDKAATKAVHTAELMNSVIKHQLDEAFKNNDVKCGIGIDYGRILVAKTGIRRNGHESHNYKSLVWLGRPANVASKLTDAANKHVHSSKPKIVEGFHHPHTSLTWGPEIDVNTFLDRLSPTYLNNQLTHTEKDFRAFIQTNEYFNETVPPILMTKPVYDLYKSENESAKSVTSGWWTKIKSVKVPGYSGVIYGGDVVFSAFTA